MDGRKDGLDLRPVCLVLPRQHQALAQPAPPARRSQKPGGSVAQLEQHAARLAK